jgi:voltage-gated potassium channel
MKNDIRTKLINALCAVAAILVIGMFGFHALLYDVSYIDALYLTVVTVATVGYGDISPHVNRIPGTTGHLAKIFSLFIIMAGVATFIYPLGIIAEHMISGELQRESRRRRMQKLISRLRGHFIVCGGGETGVTVLNELEKTHRASVLIDSSAARLNELQQRFKKLIFVEGDATDDRVLALARPGHAAGIISVLPDEKDNLIVVVSIGQVKKEKGDGFKILAKAITMDLMAPKMRATGADSVIAPSTICGRRMVSEMFRPSVTTFLDRMLRDSRGIMRIEEAAVSKGSALAGATLAEAKIPHRAGLVVVAMRKKGEQGFICNPGAAQRLDEGDVLIAMGDMKNILRLRALAGEGDA